MTYNDPYNERDQPFDPSYQHDHGRSYGDGGMGYTEKSNGAGLPTSYGGNGKEGVKSWRKADRGATWGRGGCFRTCCRFLWCFIFIGVFLALAIILTLFLYLAPPNVSVTSVTLPSSPVSYNGSALLINFGVGIVVRNPNYISATLLNLDAAAYYPNIISPDPEVGGGSLSNIPIPANSLTTFNFPITVAYTPSIDSNNKIIEDIITRCGILTGNVEDLDIDYKVNLALSVIGIKVKPNFSGSANFQCPITRSDIEKLGLSTVLGLLG